MSQNTANELIGVDWGTSSFRLFSISDDGDIVRSTTSQAGVNELGTAEFESYLRDQLLSVTKTPDRCEVLLCGMIGSSIGWTDAGYVECPVGPLSLAQKLVAAPSTSMHARIAPGLSCVSPLGQPDVMRGEETQVLGWLETVDAQAADHALLCLPGTHTKWVRIRGGQVHSFSTSYTGELFALLCEKSVLVSAQQQDSETAFSEGLQIGAKSPALSQTLFSTRSRVLRGNMPGGSAKSYLSGLLIGSDVAAALQLWQHTDVVTIIGEPKMSQCYAKALHAQSISTEIRDGTKLAALGLHAIHQHLTRRV